MAPYEIMVNAAAAGTSVRELASVLLAGSSKPDDWISPRLEADPARRLTSVGDA